MIKISVKRLESEPNLKLEFYDSISRIPLNIKLRNYEMPPSVIKFDNFERGNFVEFRFDSHVGDLFEITVVSINNNAVIFTDSYRINILNSQNNGFFIDDLKAKGVRKKLLTKIARTSTSSVCFAFGDDNDGLDYYKASGGLYIGIDSDNNLKSFYLEGLSQQNIKDIFGE
ncbi:hypothetical protein GCM10009122_56460 [Fulvivirga kasyanovii]|uniref:DUF4265 domain-containing protein n=1 Tax=Fulvivirga kasyanovii TaxID=396812 RepID=A0ABW9RHC5_9BACT|nr:hypothetical protein [Fulvivirga kasyanovii]MTI23459.1 hypothetical protein [Fulvivirga kasyanovii]